MSEEEEETATTEPGGEGPGRDSDPGSAGEPLTEDTARETGSPRTPHEPEVGEENEEMPRREEAGM
jgi:hypothetical protein